MNSPSIKRSHLETMGTTVIYNRMRRVGPSPTQVAERISRIAVMIEDNQKEIENIEATLKEPSGSYSFLFTPELEWRKKLNHKLKVRERLFDMWERAVKTDIVF